MGTVVFVVKVETEEEERLHPEVRVRVRVREEERLHPEVDPTLTLIPDLTLTPPTCRCKTHPRPGPFDPFPY